MKVEIKFVVKVLKMVNGDKQVTTRSLESDLSIVNSLIDTCAKSGDVVCARSIFDGIPSKDIISWNSLISGYVLHDFYNIALDLFDQMRGVGLEKQFIEEMAIESDPIVWVALLTACRFHGNIGLAVGIVERLIEMEPGNSTV
ncbi:hypothetical protein HHK36_013336 [Tetracentron sinense]|uniref:Pentatricopeptide repeat-containing protein n=1 Tax=Tetracentron sinense TaxID=13715 RepID=A0A834ZEE3_TETSI|nr:hypothetical protein HHK36_013336 [Tetracentron sinense]